MNMFCLREYCQVANDSVLLLLQILLLCLGKGFITGLFNLVKSADRGKHLLDAIWRAFPFCVLPKAFSQSGNSVLVWHPESLSSLPQSRQWLNLMVCIPDCCGTKSSTWYLIRVTRLPALHSFRRSEASRPARRGGSKRWRWWGSLRRCRGQRGITPLDALLLSWECNLP